MAIVKALPKTEDGRGVLCLVNGEKYQISHNTSKDKNAFTLWKIVSGGYEKVSSADMPQDLYPVILAQMYSVPNGRSSAANSICNNACSNI